MVRAVGIHRSAPYGIRALVGEHCLRNIGLDKRDPTGGTDQSDQLQGLAGSSIRWADDGHRIRTSASSVQGFWDQLHTGRKSMRYECEVVKTIVHLVNPIDASKPLISSFLAIKDISLVPVTYLR